ncbi:hypothetical protein, partial [Blastomonas sp.]|uniref:hypothetical protein n=1 Tax=Blastomonas sp. TaxID=1909299 RepID=UPI003593C8AF
MRFVALALILLSFPIFVALLNQHRRHRNTALLAIGALTFAMGTLQVDAAIITGRAWPGTVRGILVSPIDTLCWALIATRAASANRVPFIGLIVLYMVPATVSIAVSSVPTASAFVPLQVLRMLLMFIAVVGELRRPGALRSLFMGLSIGLIVQAGYVIQQKLSGMVQAHGTASHQNMLGLMVH